MAQVKKHDLRIIVPLLRKLFPIGTGVVLVKMDDKYAPPLGTEGTVTGVDDVGTIMVSWDNGSSLGVVLGADVCRKIQGPKGEGKC